MMTLIAATASGQGSQYEQGLLPVVAYRAMQICFQLNITLPPIHASESVTMPEDLRLIDHIGFLTFTWLV